MDSESSDFDSAYYSRHFRELTRFFSDPQIIQRTYVFNMAKVMQANLGLGFRIWIFARSVDWPVGLLRNRPFDFNERFERLLHFASRHGGPLLLGEGRTLANLQARSQQRFRKLSQLFRSL